MPLTLAPDPECTVEGIAPLLRSGGQSCGAVLQQCLDRIDEWEPRIRAWVHVDRHGAQEQARRLDDELRSGRDRGPLHGIPVGVKDIVDLEGFPTAAGSKLLGRDPAERDAPLVRKLREAGAVILGKTVTTQYACFDPPVTKNPWNEHRTPGGSSSGSAAAVAVGMCLAAIGSQTGGSITRPAAYCGIAGCKPTAGRVSLRGVFPVAPSLDHAGPLARTVRDLAAVVDAVSGYDPADLHSADHPPTALWTDLEAGSTAPPKIGRLRGLFRERAEPDMHKAMESAQERLRRAGASIVEVDLPDGFDDVLPCHRTIMAVEAAALHEKRLAEHPDDYRPNVRSLVEEGLRTSAPDYARCREHQLRMRREILACFDGAGVLVCPAAPGPAPEASTTGDPAFNSPWSYTGLPTVSIPVGLSENGLPLAAQLVGRPFGESDLFRTAAWCEEVLVTP